MSILYFYRAVLAGNMEALRKYHCECKKFPVNKNFTYINGRILRLPLIIAFYEGRLETASYLLNNGARLDLVCKSCKRTPREFMPEGFPEDNCRIMSCRVFKERVTETVFNHRSGNFDKGKLLKRLEKNDPFIMEMYEYATNEEMFLKNCQEDLEPEEKLKRFRNGEYLWGHIYRTAQYFQ